MFLVPMEEVAVQNAFAIGKFPPSSTSLSLVGSVVRAFLIEEQKIVKKVLKAQSKKASSK